MNNQHISVSISTLLAIPAIVLLTILLWQLRGLILVLMIAVVLAASIVPVVNWAERFYQLLAVLGGTQVLGLIGALVVPPWLAGAAVLIKNLYLKPKLTSGQPKAEPSDFRYPQRPKLLQIEVSYPNLLALDGLVLTNS